jgi:acetoin utilization protein AcuC
VSDSVLVLWDEALLRYEFGPHHPMHPVRLELTMALAGELGVLDRPNVRVNAPRAASDQRLERVHDASYVDAVRGAPRDPTAPALRSHGLGTHDNPVFDGMHDASALIAGGSVDGAGAVWRGEAQHAVNLAGGLHHAMRSRASGFCVYNDAAVAIAGLLDDGARRVAYVDVDAHHGDGVQAAFYDDPRVLTISLHESGYSLFPGTGFPGDVGTGRAEGTAVNVALPTETADAGWLRAFFAVVPPLLRAFEPQIVVTQHGCDSHRLDPLANLNLSVDAHRMSYAALHALAHEVAGGRWVALGGGGYDPVSVVPRSWTHLLAEATGGGLDRTTETPEGWRTLVLARTGRPAPESLSDGTEPTYARWDAGEGDEDDPLDRAVAATRREILPLHGLDPLDPR